MKALVAVLLAAVLAVVLVAREDASRGGTLAPSAGPLLGVVEERGRSWLVRVAPVSLRPLAGNRVRLDASGGAWSRSPGNGSRLAVAGDDGATLRVIDVDRMRPLGRVRTGARGAPAAVIWAQPRRVFVLVARPGCCAIGSTTVVTVDPVARRVIARHEFDGGLARVSATPDGPVLLLAPPDMIGPAALATVDATGAVDVLPIDGMSTGVSPTEGVPFVVRERTPALAVDAERRRAYLLSSRPHTIEVDLRRGRVRHHRLTPSASLLDRLRELLQSSGGAGHGDDLLEPTAKGSPRLGPVRSAAWLGDAKIAVSGRDAHVVWRGGGAIEARVRAAGVRIVDTRDWTVRTLDERAAAFDAAAGLLLTRGPGGRGLAAYRHDGRGRFLVLPDRRVEVVATAGALAYVRAPGENALHVVDLERGRVIGRTAPDRARLLLETVPTGWQ